jgi:hypothetical protein
MRALVATAGVLGVLTAGLIFTRPNLAEACAGLIGSNGAVSLGRTTTLAAYTNGVEHYVTSFTFQGGGGQFGSLIPLPGVPTNVERGGDWTLERLQLETALVQASVGGPASGGAGGTGAGVSVLQEVRIDALDLTVLSGGGPDVAVWAEEHGFRLSPDAPEVLDFYASRSPIFLAAVFDSAAAAQQGQVFGDGTPVHLTIPTDNPWVPLRILGLGKQAEEFIFADVFVLTDRAPEFLPKANNGLFLSYYGEASDLLLDDLRADAGMAWMPEYAWLTKLQVQAPTRELQYDLAVDASGEGRPSLLSAGLIPLPKTGTSLNGGTPVSPEAALLVGIAVVVDALSVAFVWGALRGRGKTEV